MTVEAQAKVNFTLEVYGKRPDGYHDLRSVVMPISLADTLGIEATADGSISSDTGYADDLCVKAASVLRSTLCLQPSTLNPQPSTVLGAHICVTKRIPAGGGLGGGSADAAAVLVALNELWQLGYGRERLAEIGAAVGSDVPALVLGGPVLMEGRGERVARLATSTATFSRNLHLVLVHPGVFSSTKEVYGACAPRADGLPSATDSMVAALATGDLKQIAAAFANDLQASAEALHPEIAAALEALRAQGAIGTLMSGSGSCVFGLVESEVAAERIAAELSATGLQAWPVRTL